jgi:hypothetical protein
MVIRTLLIGMLFLVSPLAMAEMEYHGFHIDDHLLDRGQEDSFSALAWASVIEQLHIVESVNLPPELLNFFKQTRILVDPALRGNPGVFSVRAGEGAVHIRPIVFPANKPILLHELLHAYHYSILSLTNPAVLSAYDAASRAGVYPVQFQKAHFLANEKEFFAVTGTIYLFGEIQQPPFNCEILSKSDPAYLAFLEKTFGRHDCQ